jgi:hypothetical protein
MKLHVMMVILVADYVSQKYCQPLLLILTKYTFLNVLFKDMVIYHYPISD